ncbi:MAG: YbaB/EbfC family nucleoid-associated protein [Ruminococcaceae bacterium]|nr:YbaB/EbfC family nucleoid-associated protein [Oscillospiraceae bacterium]
MKARLPKGMGGGPQNMQSMIKQAQKMQEDMERVQAELEEEVTEVTAGGGAVKVEIKGNREILSIELDEDVVDPDDIETLQDLIVAAVNEAIKTVDEKSNAAMSKVTGNLSMPGLF